MQLIAIGAGFGLLGALSLAADAEPLTARIGATGEVSLKQGKRDLATIAPGLFEAGWQHAGLSGKPVGEGDDESLRQGAITAPSGVGVTCELRPEVGEGELLLQYTLTPQADIKLNALFTSLEFSESALAGGSFTADGEQGAFPKVFGDIQLRSEPTTELALTLATGLELQLAFEQATPVLLQDNREWGPSFSVRIGPQLTEGDTWPAGKALELAFTLTASEGLQVEFDGPVTIEPGEEWLPLELELDIEPGSALDFSGFGQIDAPAGKHGWLVATPDGQLAFSDSLETPRRFCGVNLCFSAHYITHEQSDRLAERLVRLGYNTVRFHHFESELVDRSGGQSTKLNAEKLDQLDYLFAALKKRGIYITTDLFISRPIYAAEVYDGVEGNLEMNDIKMAIPVNQRAFENWKDFSRNLLGHTNPHTGLTWAEDPTLAWISMINEGNFGNYIYSLRGPVRDDWQAAWNAWLVAKYGDRAGLAEAWGEDPKGDPAQGSVDLQPTNSESGHDSRVFLAETDRDMCTRMREFLRDEMGTQALLTNMNGWSNPVQAQLARREYDYVDDHFYVDHPQFIEQPWRLPSRCPNSSPVAAGAPGGRGIAFVRLLDKPFTISEYNYSGPGRFRGVGGIITGCMAALQGHSVVWRFAYSHSRDNLFQPGTAGYFDLAVDPLNQAAERASLCLFLRGDMQPAPHRVAIGMTPEDLTGRPDLNAALAPKWNALALVTGVGSYIGDGPAPADLVVPAVQGSAVRAADGARLDVGAYEAEAGDAILAELRDRGWLAEGNITDLAARRSESETGELVVDGPRDVLVLNTPATAGGYAPAGESIEAGAVTVTIDETDATVWVSSVDGKPIAESARLLITHLTDLQNTGARFGEIDRKTLLDWGGLPHLVRTGRATVRIAGRGAEGVEVWAISTSGRRLEKIDATVDEDDLVIPLSVEAGGGARLMYEVVVGTTDR